LREIKRKDADEPYARVKETLNLWDKNFGARETQQSPQMKIETERERIIGLTNIITAERDGDQN